MSTPVQAWTRAARCVAALMLLAPAAVRAQAITIFPVQDLSFGQIRAGFNEKVEWSDAPRRAELEVRARGRVVIDVTLPTEMISAGGQRFPLRFDASVGQIQWLRNGRRFPFDPRSPRSIRIPRRQRGALIFLGGTAEPAVVQAPGPYGATITVRVSNAGT